MSSILLNSIVGPIDFQNIPDQHKTLLNGAIEAIEKLQSTPDITPEAKAVLVHVGRLELGLIGCEKPGATVTRSKFSGA